MDFKRYAEFVRKYPAGVTSGSWGFGPLESLNTWKLTKATVPVLEKYG